MGACVVYVVLGIISLNLSGAGLSVVWTASNYGCRQNGANKKDRMMMWP